jgi:hypothetical protein
MDMNFNRIDNQQLSKNMNVQEEIVFYIEKIDKDPQEEVTDLIKNMETQYKKYTKYENFVHRNGDSKIYLVSGTFNIPIINEHIDPPPIGIKQITATADFTLTTPFGDFDSMNGKLDIVKISSVLKKYKTDPVDIFNIIMHRIPSLLTVTSYILPRNIHIISENDIHEVEVTCYNILMSYNLGHERTTIMRYTH